MSHTASIQCYIESCHTPKRSRHDLLCMDHLEMYSEMRGVEGLSFIQIMEFFEDPL